MQIQSGNVSSQQSNQIRALRRFVSGHHLIFCLKTEGSTKLQYTTSPLDVTNVYTLVLYDMKPVKSQ